MRLPLLLLCCLVLSTTAKAQAGAKPKVLASASIFRDMCAQIAGDLVALESIVPVGGDPHMYEPTPRDSRLVYEADLILLNGLTFEGWIGELIAHSGTRAEVVYVTEGIVPIASSEYANATDPHAWMDASNGLIYIANIKDALIALDPAHSAQYQARYEAYRARLLALDAYIMAEIAKIPPAQRLLVTSHDAFHYYGKRYGLDLAPVMGTSTDADVQAGDMAVLQALIRERGLPAVFIESTINPKLLKQLASDNGVRIGGKLYADSIGAPDSEAPTYEAMLRHNTDVIVAGLSGQAGDGPAPAAKERPAGQSWLFGILGTLFVGAFAYVGWRHS